MKTRWILAAILALTISGASAAENPYPQDWFWSEGETKVAHESMIGKPMPPLDVTGWINGEVTKADMKGKILIVDFWATWCGPCIRSIPHNNEMQEKYGDKGVQVIGICGSNGQEKMADVVKKHGVKYPVAKDASMKTAPAWNVAFWPTYAVVDRKGIVRAVGLQPDYVDDVVDSILKEDRMPGAEDAAANAENKSADLEPAKLHFEMAKTKAGTPDIEEEWLEGDRERFAGLQGQKAPSLSPGTNWLNAEPMDIADLKGKIVVLDFWATWCGPCIRAVPHTNELAEKYINDVVIIGVCHPKGAEKMEETAKQHDMRYALVADADGEINKAYKADSYPDYYVIDQEGNLVAPDAKNGSVEDIIKALLNTR